MKKSDKLDEFAKMIARSVDEYPYLMDVCVFCSHSEGKREKCRECCFFYGSRFELDRGKK